MRSYKSQATALAIALLSLPIAVQAWVVTENTTTGIYVNSQQVTGTVSELSCEYGAGVAVFKGSDGNNYLTVAVPYPASVSATSGFTVPGRIVLVPVKDSNGNPVTLTNIPKLAPVWGLAQASYDASGNLTSLKIPFAGAYFDSSSGTLYLYEPTDVTVQPGAVYSATVPSIVTSQVQPPSGTTVSTISAVSRPVLVPSQSGGYTVYLAVVGTDSNGNPAAELWSVTPSTSTTVTASEVCTLQPPSSSAEPLISTVGDDVIVAFEDTTDWKTDLYVWTPGSSSATSLDQQLSQAVGGTAGTITDVEGPVFVYQCQNAPTGEVQFYLGEVVIGSSGPQLIVGGPFTLPLPTGSTSTTVRVSILDEVNTDNGTVYYVLAYDDSSTLAVFEVSPQGVNTVQTITSSVPVDLASGDLIVSSSFNSIAYVAPVLQPVVSSVQGQLLQNGVVNLPEAESTTLTFTVTAQTQSPDVIPHYYTEIEVGVATTLPANVSSSPLQVQWSPTTLQPQPSTQQTVQVTLTAGAVTSDIDGITVTLCLAAVARDPLTHAILSVAQDYTTYPVKVNVINRQVTMVVVPIQVTKTDQGYEIQLRVTAYDQFGNAIQLTEDDLSVQDSTGTAKIVSFQDGVLTVDSGSLDLTLSVTIPQLAYSARVPVDISEAALQGVLEGVQNLENQVSQVSQEVENVQNTLNQVSQNVQTIEENMATKSDIQDVEQKLDEIESKIGTSSSSSGSPLIPFVPPIRRRRKG
ncbi:MAG: hypothetical protein GXO28_07610 [Methanopyri archaeon]|nr:hypothetical protein [Methanopyri archaeon]